MAAAGWGCAATGKKRNSKGKAVEAEEVAEPEFTCIACSEGVKNIR